MAQETTDTQQAQATTEQLQEAKIKDLSNQLTAATEKLKLQEATIQEQKAQLDELKPLIESIITEIKNFDPKNMTVGQIQESIKKIQDALDGLGDIKDEFVADAKKQISEFLVNLDNTIKYKADDIFGEGTSDKITDVQEDIQGFFDKYGKKINEAVKYILIFIILWKLFF